MNPDLVEIERKVLVDVPKIYGVQPDNCNYISSDPWVGWPSA